MIATTLDLMLKRYGKQAEGKRPTILPTLSRTHLPSLCRELGFTKGAEIGVWKGAYSATFCEASPAMHMLCVDPWLSYPAWLDTKNSMTGEKAEAFMASAYGEALARLTPLNTTIMRAFSVDAATAVPDGSLDLLYVDGNHVYDAVIEDLTFWAPKVRHGGIIAGHDYRIFTNKPTIHVVKAVQDYTKAHGITRWFTTGADRTPSFLWIVQ